MKRYSRGRLSRTLRRKLYALAWHTGWMAGKLQQSLKRYKHRASPLTSRSCAPRLALESVPPREVTVPLARVNHPTNWPPNPESGRRMAEILNRQLGPNLLSISRMTGRYTKEEVSPIGEKHLQLVSDTAQKVAELMQCNSVEVELAILRAMTGAVEITNEDGGKRVYRFSWDE